MIEQGLSLIFRAACGAADGFFDFSLLLKRNRPSKGFRLLRIDGRNLFHPPRDFAHAG